MSSDYSSYPRRIDTLRLAVAFALCVALFGQVASAKPKIRDSFFEVYPDAIGTVLDTVPSNTNHCGVCHWKFEGSGARNPYGAALEAALPGYPNTAAGRFDAILSIQLQDPDGDGFSTLVEVTDTINYINTPTFPGLTPGNVGGVLDVDVADIQDSLVPSAGGDTTLCALAFRDARQHQRRDHQHTRDQPSTRHPGSLQWDMPAVPDVAVISPDGGETLTGNTSTTVEWIAGDASGIAGINLYVSLDGGTSYKPVALGLANTGSHTWFPANRPTAQALFLVEAIDNAFNIGWDDSDSVFTIESPPGGLAPTTLRDFDQPGTQPLHSGILNPPEGCVVCHGNYDTAVEPYFNWRGGMMANASRDPLFEANMVIANQDAPDSGDLCLRCHIGRGWLQGRSVPTDGSQMLSTDRHGVACDLCHRMVDPIYSPQNPAEDIAILAALDFPPDTVGTGMYVIDPTGARRGPFINADSGHPVLISPFHRDAALCGTCHDVSNPAFEKDINGNYVPNAFDAPATDFSAHTVAPVERTYSEWFYSDYNTVGGVYAPQFGGNKDYVSICQDCHMRDVTGEGCNSGTAPTRTDLPLHDFTGGSTWMPGLLAVLYPGEVDQAAVQASTARAQYMMENAATLDVAQNDSTLEVTVTNQTGHKLPTGYPEGRRMWINVKFYDSGMNLISESGAYDPATGILTHDPEIKIYEVKPGLDAITAPIAGEPEGASFHFVLNNKVYKDNRIPPRGFTNSSYEDFGGAPVGATYADGQYWDVTTYAIPPGAAYTDVTLSYQSTSKEFVEFLRDKNVTDDTGLWLYDLWNDNGKSPPQTVQRVLNMALEGQVVSPVPSISGWGLSILSLLVIASGALPLARRR